MLHASKECGFVDSWTVLDVVGSPGAHAGRKQLSSVLRFHAPRVARSARCMGGACSQRRGSAPAASSCCRMGSAAGWLPPLGSRLTQ